MPGHTFISYSRHQYYFAESLTLHLQQRGIPVWFDLQQIEPGEVWKADIQNGLDQAASVTLVASRSAMRSPYVAQEWQHALNTHKPIYVARYEAVRLPAALRQQATIIDFRGDFECGVNALAACISNPTKAAACTPPRRLLVGLPDGVRRMALAIVLYDLVRMAYSLLELVALYLITVPGTIVRVTLDISRPLLDLYISQIVEQIGQWWTTGIVALAGVLILVGFSSLFGLILPRSFGRWSNSGKFLNHKFEYERLLRSLGKPTFPKLATYAIGVLAFSYLVFQTDIPANILGTNTLREYGRGAGFGLETLFGLAAGVVVLRLAPRVVRRVIPHTPDPDVIRWSVVRTVPQNWRMQVNRPLLAEPAADTDSTEFMLQQTGRPREGISVPAPANERPSPLPGLPVTVHLVAAPLDDSLKAKVAAALNQVGIRVAESGAAAAYTVLVLTYRTPVELVMDTIHATQEKDRGVIAVMATNVRLPQKLMALQIIDYRDQSALELEAAFRFLKNHTQSARAVFSQQLLPPQVTRQRNDGALQLYTAGLIGLAGFLGSVSIWGIVSLSSAGESILQSEPGNAPIIGLTLLALPLALILGWQGLSALGGRSRFPKIAVRAVAILSLLVLFAAQRLGMAYSPVLNPIITAVSGGHATSIDGLLALSALVSASIALSSPILASWRDNVLGMKPLLHWRTLLLPALAILSILLAVPHGWVVP